MSEWKEYKLSDLAKNKGDLVSGPFGSNISSQFFVETGVPVIRGNNLTDKNKEFYDDGFVFITEEKAYELRNCIAIKDDVLFTAVGTLGQIGIIPENTKYSKYIISNKQIRLRVDKDLVYPKYLYYCLTTNQMRTFIESLNRGSSVPLLTLGEVKRISIKLPSLNTQSKTIKILSAYDELIEVNNERIKILEETAQSLYKEWFVRFRFPNYQNTEFIKGVPKGWEVIRFRDFIKLNRGFDLPNDKIVEGEFPVIASTNIKAFHNEYKSSGEGVITGRSGSLGVVQYINGNYWTLNTALYVKDFKGNFPKYVYYFLKEMHLENFDSGAGVPTLNQNHLHGLRFPLPPINLQKQFNEIISPMFTQIETLQQQNTELRQIRDRLLPRLISGKLLV